MTSTAVRPGRPVASASASVSASTRRQGLGDGPGKVCRVVERASARLHRFERLRIRYGRRADPLQGPLGPACGLLCPRRLRTPS